jgi:hypothetical protein
MANAPETCPNCGAEVPTAARACPDCGACEATGWSEQARADALELPDSEIDYDAFVQREFGGGTGGERQRLPWRWILLALLLAGALAWWSLRG